MKSDPRKLHQDEIDFVRDVAVAQMSDPNVGDHVGALWRRVYLLAEEVEQLRRDLAKLKADAADEALDAKFEAD